MKLHQYSFYCFLLLVLLLLILRLLLVLLPSFPYFALYHFLFLIVISPIDLFRSSSSITCPCSSSFTLLPFHNVSFYQYSFASSNKFLIPIIPSTSPSPLHFLLLPSIVFFFLLTLLSALSSYFLQSSPPYDKIHIALYICAGKAP